MKKDTRLLLFSCIFLVAVAGTLLTLYFTRGTLEPPPPPPPPPQEVVFTKFEEGKVSSIFITNSHSSEGYSINASTAGEFFIMQISEQFPIEQRLSIPYNQDALADAARKVSDLSSATLVEAAAQDLEQYGLTDENFSARVGATFFGGVQVAFMVGNGTPVGADAYFRLSHSNDVYAIPQRDIAPFLASRYHYLQRTAFPQFEPREDLERVTIDRIDWREQAVAPMVIVPLEGGGGADLPDLRSFNNHKLISPIEIELCPENSVPLLFGMYGVQAREVVAVVPSEEDLVKFGFKNEEGGWDSTCRVEVKVADAIFVLTIGASMVTEQGDVLGWFAMSNQTPNVVYLFAEDNLPWLTVTIDKIHSTSFLQPFIYSVDRLVLETPGQKHEFEITGDEHANRIYHTSNNNTLLEGTIRQEDSPRGRFSSLYMYLVSVRMQELFIDENPPDSAFIARITYKYRDESRSDDVVEFYSTGEFLSILRVNGVNLYKVRESYTTRLVSNITAFAAGEGIINDY